MRFRDKVKNSSYVKPMTDGILLAEIQADTAPQVDLNDRECTVGKLVL